MKRKFFSILFALVLVASFSMVTAVPAAAAETHNVIPFTVNDDELVEEGGLALWSTECPHSGSSSVQLYNLDVTDSDYWAEVFFGVDIALGDIDLATTSFWANSCAGDYIPYFIFEIPGAYPPNDGVMLRISNDAAPSTEFIPGWAEFVASDAIGPWLWDILDAEGAVVLDGHGETDWVDLTTVITGLTDESIVNCVVVSLSDITTSLEVSHSINVDLVTVSGTTYDLEGTDTDFTTFQAAIDAANDGDTINVLPGIYNTGSGETFPITVNKSVTLKSLTGDYRTSGVTVHGHFYIPQVSAKDDIAMQGFNFVVTPGTNAESACGIGGYHSGGDQGYGDNITILSNSFTASPASSNVEPAIGIYGQFTVEGLVIDDNLFTGVRGMHLLTLDSEVTITNNVVDGDSTTPPFAGISVAGVTGIISDNEISYTFDAGINVGNLCDDLTISNNTVTNAGEDGGSNEGAINLYSDCTNITITGNTLADSYDGITIKNVSALGAGITINYNNITGNSNFGVFSAVSGMLEATNNWWDSASGPERFEPIVEGYESYGDNVSANVDYEPWLLGEVDIEEVAVGILPTTFEKTLALREGWTLVSTDQEVGSGTTWVGETIAYKYTGTAYTVIELATQLTPVDAYYVKTVDGGGVGINYSTDQPAVVTKDLFEGWNLIGCAGFDAMYWTDPGEEYFSDAYTILTQLRHFQIGGQQGVGLTTLVGQASYNQFLPSSLSLTLVDAGVWDYIDPHKTGEPDPIPLIAFNGYWVYMNAAKSFGVIPD